MLFFGTFRAISRLCWREGKVLEKMFVWIGRRTLRYTQNAWQLLRPRRSIPLEVLAITYPTNQHVLACGHIYMKDIVW
jgi:hypothetical protein